MPRRDLYDTLHADLTFPPDTSDRGNPGSLQDPGAGCYRSGFWGVFRLGADREPGRVQVGIRVRLDDGGFRSVPLGEVEVVHPMPGPSLAEGADARATVAICLATFEPEPDLFRIQIDSIRAQSDSDWVCLISDDCSSPESFAQIEEIVGKDQRFLVSRSTERQGFYRNFERALGMVPPEAELIALSDQDDYWYPDKLSSLCAALGDSRMVYSDARLVDTDGQVLKDTLWIGRRNNHTNLASLLIANSIGGSSALFRRDVMEDALPFPEAPGWNFHDHWLAQVAMAGGDVAYVSRPLFDYVQHAGAITGQVAVEEPRSRSTRLDPRRLRGAFSRWKALYFYAYLPLQFHCRAVLIRLPDRITGRKRRILERLIDSADSPIWMLWLALRPLRSLAGRNETLLSETRLVRGILWRWLIALRVRGRERPGDATYDAAMPPFDPTTSGNERLKRWRSGS